MILLTFTQQQNAATAGQTFLASDTLTTELTSYISVEHGLHRSCLKLCQLIKNVLELIRKLMCCHYSSNV